MEGILSFSTKPLKITFTLGILCLLASFIYLIVLLVMGIGYSYEITAIYVLIDLFLLISGLQFIVLGIIGAYLSKMYVEIKNRPTYIVKEKLGFNDETIL